MNKRLVQSFFFFTIASAAMQLRAMNPNAAVQSKSLSSENIVETLIEKEKATLARYKEKEQAIMESLSPARRQELLTQRFVRRTKSEKVRGEETLLRYMSVDELRREWAYAERGAEHPEHFRWVVAGDLDYFMSLEQLRNKVKEELLRLYKNGQLLTEEQFQKLDRTKWYQRDNKLSRIFGAEYLDSQFKRWGMNDWHVPQFILVVPSLDDIQVKIEWGSCMPRLARIVNGTVYAENIEQWEDFSAQSRLYLAPLGYIDFAGFGNVVKKKDGSYYVLDTEIKSLMKDEEDDLPVLKPAVPWLTSWRCEYLRKRFAFVNGVPTQTNYIMKLDLQ